MSQPINQPINQLLPNPKIFKANLNYLAEPISNDLSSYSKMGDKFFSPLEVSEIEVLKSKTGLPVFKYRNKWAHSRFDPVNEAKRKWKNRNYQGQKNWFCSQANFLYEVEFAIKEINRASSRSSPPKPSLYLLYESKLLFIKLLEYRNLEFLALFKKVEVFFPTKFNELLEKINQLKPDDLFSFYDPLNLIGSDFIDQIEKNIVIQKKKILSSHITSHQFQIRWLKNTILNLRQVEKMRPFNNLLGGFAKKRVLIVGAGLSLKQIKKMIEEIDHKVYIIAIDTALPYLLKNNIIPNFVVVLDGGYANSLDFKNMLEWYYRDNKQRADKLRLITPLFAYPSIINNFLGEIYIFKIKNQTDLVGKVTEYILTSLSRFIAPSTGKEESGFFNQQDEVVAGSSVASTLINLIRLMGFRKVDIIGFDFMSIFYQNHLFASMHFDLYYAKSNRLNSLEKYEFIETTLGLDSESKEKLNFFKAGKKQKLSHQQSSQKFTTISFNMRKYQVEFVNALKEANLEIGKVYSYNKNLKTTLFLAQKRGNNFFLNQSLDEQVFARKRIPYQVKEIKAEWLKKINLELNEIKKNLDNLLVDLDEGNFNFEKNKIIKNIFPDVLTELQIKGKEKQRKIILFYFRVINIMIFSLKKVS